jgi:hypothetical protein
MDVYMPLNIVSAALRASSAGRDGEDEGEEEEEEEEPDEDASLELVELLPLQQWSIAACTRAEESTRA